MFSINRSDLIIGGNLWVMKFDPNVTSTEALGLPKRFEYAGRYSSEDGGPDHIKLYDTEERKQFRIDIGDGYSVISTGFYILSHSKQDIFRRISDISRRGNMSVDLTYMAKLYVKYIKDKYPEYSI